MSINDVKWGNLSPERRQAFERALTGAGVATGSGLLQDFVNRTIQQLTVREWGLSNFLDRKPGSGSQAIINRRDPNAALASWVATNTDPTEGTGTYSQATFAYQTLATRGTVARKLIAQGRTYSDVLADEMAAKAEDFMYQLETSALTGRNAADAVPDGFLTLINDNALAGTNVDFVVDGNNPSEAAGAFGGGGAALTLGMLDRLVDKCKGSSIPSDLALVVSPKMNRVLAALLQADQRFTNQVEIAAGIIVRTYLGIPIIVSTAMPDTVTDAAGAGGGAAPNLTDAANMFTAGDNSIIMCINKRYNWIEELTPMTVLPLAKTTSASDSFDMFMDATFVNANTRGAVALIGLNGT